MRIHAWRCPKCNALNGLHTLFCVWCGKKIPDWVAEAIKTQRARDRMARVQERLKDSGEEGEL